MRISLLCLICLLPLFCESKSIEDVLDTKLGVSEKVLVAEAKTAKKNENENKLARVDSVTSSSDPGDPAPSESSTAGSTPSESSTAGSTPSESSTADSAPSESSTADSAPSESSTAGSTPSESSTADSTPSESSTAGSTPSESSTAGSTPSESSTAGSQDRKPTSTTTTAATTTTTSPAPRPQGLTQEKFFDQAVKRLLDRFSEEGDAIQVTLTQDTRIFNLSKILFGWNDKNWKNSAEMIVLKHISSSNLALRTNKDVYSFQEKNNPEIQEKLLKQLPREENIPTNKQNVYLKSVLNHYRTASSAKRGKREAGNAIIQGTHIIDDMKITNIAYDSIRNVPRVLIGVKCTIGPITFKPADAPSQDPIVYFNLTDEFNVEIKERSPGSYRLRILNHDVDVFMSKSITINKTGLDSQDRRNIRRELYDVVMSLDLESKFYSDLRSSLATVEVADGFTYDSRFTPQTVVALRRNDFSE